MQMPKHLTPIDTQATNKYPRQQEILQLHKGDELKLTST